MKKKYRMPEYDFLTPEYDFLKIGAKVRVNCEKCYYKVKSATGLYEIKIEHCLRVLERQGFAHIGGLPWEKNGWTVMSGHAALVSGKDGFSPGSTEIYLCCCPLETLQPAESLVQLTLWKEEELP